MAIGATRAGLFPVYPQMRDKTKHSRPKQHMHICQYHKQIPIFACHSSC